MLYSLVIQQPNPLFKHYHPAIRPLCSPRSPVTKRATCCALYARSGVSPASAPQQQTTLVLLADKHTRNARLLSEPSNHVARGVPDQDSLARTPLCSMMMKSFPSGNGHRYPKQADGNDYR
ncbi:hypothetical protein O181_050656 [Austropuccinia psidii MF-1]|uniref:Uncharacterized protein n=1 Tax=Austropuccinia psidii MF-1 TaxID=1389203 RepID=A0A9Q3HMK2_9BASI|nr:hypothetical protein [Austropuccinia psidii MF-1]